MREKVSMSEPHKNQTHPHPHINHEPPPSSTPACTSVPSFPTVNKILHNDTSLSTLLPPLPTTSTTTSVTPPNKFLPSNYKKALTSSLPSSTGHHTYHRRQPPAPRTNPLPPSDGFLSIPLPPDLIKSIHSPWHNSLIIKVRGKSLESGHLASAIRTLWNINGPINLIGLGKGFYSCKLDNLSDLISIKTNGPWFVHGHYLHVQDWVPNFRPSLATISSVPTWIVLPELPIEYHRIDILRAIGDKLGGFIKYDGNEMRNKNARFARISVYLDQSVPSPSNVWIGSFCQEIKIVDKQILCLLCKSFCYGKCSGNGAVDRPKTRQEKVQNCTMDADQHTLANAQSITEPLSGNDTWNIVPFKNKGD